MKHLLVLALTSCGFAADPATVAGKWRMVIDTPHGQMDGALELKQEGAKLSGTLTTEQTGACDLTGSVDGRNVSWSFEAMGMQLKMTGKLDDGKMSGATEPFDAPWTATRPVTYLGSVVRIDPDQLEYTVKTDSGGAEHFRVGPETEVLQIAPGEQDLSQAKPSRVTDVAIGDRVLVSFVAGVTEARRMVLVSSDDIARRNEAEKADWQKRGVSGIVASKTAEEIALETRTAGGVQKTTVVIGGKTKIRQYAPDSVSFAAARPAALDAVSVGDQVRVRGNRSADGSRLLAEDVVFGTFLTKVGTIVSVDRAARQVQIQDLATKSPLTVKLSPASQVKMMPAGGPGGSGGHGHEPTSPADIAQILQQMPACKLEDLKTGSAVVVTATRGTRPGEVTAILLLANMDMLIEMAKSQAASAGISVADAMAGMHGGMLSGPSGFTLPAILQ
jgi:hypothetical protein